MSISSFDQVPVQLAPSSEAAPGLARAIRWGRVTVVGLVAMLLALAAAMASSLWCLTLLHELASGGTFTEDEVAVRTGASRVTSQLDAVVFIVSGIVWLIWLYKSYAGLNHLGTRQTRHAPGWAVFVWFVPVLSLIVPYQVVRELWLRSAVLNATEPEWGEQTPLISGWWAIFLFSNLAGLVAGALRFRAIRDPTTAFEVILATQIFHAGAAILAIMVVRKISSFQHQALVQGNAVAA
jgi:hypothetical protein